MSTATAMQELVPLGRALEPLRETIDGVWQGLAPDGKAVRPVKIALTGTDHGDGVTTMAACLAIGLAENLREPVLLLEANTPRPFLAEIAGSRASPGFSELLRGEATPKAVLRRTDVQGLAIVTGGKAAPLVRGQFSLETTQELLQNLFQHARYIVVDTPPLLLYPEIRTLFWTMDAVIPVFHAGRTRRTEGRKLLEALKASRTAVLGGILNRYRAPAPGWLIGRDPL